ncbi:hypothetical protein Tco_1248990 [Tanacetum coccineum]
MSLANQKATTEYQEAIQATEDLESPAVGFAKTSDYKGEFLDEYLPQWDENLTIQKKESELEWENPFVVKRGENHTILHLSKEEEKDENDDLPYPKFQNFKQVATQIIKKHEEHVFPSSSSQIESTQSYQPPHDSIMGPPVYPPTE